MALTAAPVIPAVASISNRLQELLEQARSLKSTTGVDPALPTTELAESVDRLDVDLDASDEAYKFVAVETAARDQFYSLIDVTSIEDPAFVEVWNLLDILLLCGDRGKCQPELVCSLIEALLDSQTTDGCRTVFDYLESRRERLARKDFHKKNLIFLRSCNELLRRLSRAEDAIFCGRVFFFLFQTFPLGDKSSVNLRGEFHTENLTKFDVPADSVANDGEHMDIDQLTKHEVNTPKSTPANDSTPQPPSKPGSKAAPVKGPRKSVEEEVLDSNTLYPIFWHLQQDFSDPTRLFAADHFSAFKKGLAATLAKFRKTPTVQAKSVEDDQRGTKRKLAASNGESELPATFVDNYNPKYLTSRDLFNLELSDLAFQRHILVQALILIDFLLSLTEKAKKRIESLASQKALLYPFTLSEADTKWAQSTRSTIKQSLQSTQDGRFYDRMVETVLARDKNWVRWKVESCPSIVRDAVSTASELEARAGARNSTRPRKVPAKPSNAMDLSFLEEGTGRGLEALKDPSHYTAPTIEDLLKGIENDELDLEMAMDEEETQMYNNLIANKTWRALREARASRLGMLDKVEAGKGLGEVLRAPEVDTTHEKEDLDGDAAAVEAAKSAGASDEHASAPEPMETASVEPAAA